MVRAHKRPADHGRFPAWYGHGSPGGGELGNMCSMALAMGKDVQTDCNIHGKLRGKTYCFGSKEAISQFMENPKDNLAKAQAYYSSKHPG